MSEVFTAAAAAMGSVITTTVSLIGIVIGIAMVRIALDYFRK